MLELDDMDALLVAYADGELDATTMTAVEAYIAVTPAAERTLAIHRETASLLRAAFAETLFVKPDIQVPQPRRRRATTHYGWAVAASLLLGVMGYGAGATWPDLLHSEHDRMLSEITEYHSVFSRETTHLVEIPAAQTDTLKAWLGERVSSPLVIPDFREAGLSFAGGRMVVIDGAPVAELMFTRASGRPLAFCVVARAGKPSGIAVAQRGDITLASWGDGAHAYVIVGEAEAKTLRDLATIAQRQI